MSLPPFSGLSNPRGAQNCFLNSVLHVLWHVAGWRERLLHDREHACVGGDGCVYCAVRAVLREYATGKNASVDVLRIALAMSFPGKFPIGRTADAYEAFATVLGALHACDLSVEAAARGGGAASGAAASGGAASGGAAAGALVDRGSVKCTAPHCAAHETFGCELLDQWQCSCGATCDPEPFDLATFGLVVYAADLVGAAGRYEARRRDASSPKTKLESALASAVQNSFSDTGGGDAATTAAAPTAVVTPADAAGAPALERPATAHGVRSRRKWDCKVAGCQQRQILQRHILNSPVVRSRVPAR